jgi:hypothetical protein
MIDLSPFCADPYPHPFTQGDYTYATDLHIIVRVAKREDAPIDPEPPVWNLGKYLARADLVKYRGLVEVSEEYRWPEGVSDLVACKVGVAWFDRKYIHKLNVLPGLETSHSGQLEPMPFRFTGGVGLLMPMKPPIKKAA